MDSALTLEDTFESRAMESGFKKIMFIFYAKGYSFLKNVKQKVSIISPIDHISSLEFKEDLQILFHNL